MNFQPVTVNERVTTLDLLRGFSLLGILLVNIFGFSLPMPHITDLASWFTDAKDIIHHQLLDIYVQSSFYPLFSMLFGYGLAMQYLKAQRTKTAFYPFARKRLIILLGIGLLHAFLIWWGDILAQYAFCGFFVLLMIHLRSSKLITIAILLNALMHMFYLSLYQLAGYFSQEVEAPTVDLLAIQNAITAYATGTWSDTFFQRLADLSIQMGVWMWVSSLFTILPYMLIGAAAAKWQLIERARDLKVLWFVIAVGGIGAGLLLKSAPFMATRTYGLEYLKVYVGGPLLAVGYIGLLVVVCLIPFAVKVLSPIAKAGRMSMTLYLMQSVICTTIFYNWGFGLYGKLDVLTGIWLAVGIFVIQILFAELWLMKFKQGPIEMMMKKIIYQKLLSEK